MSSNDAAIIDRLKTAKNYKEFHSRITKILNDLGFDCWMYTRLDIPLSVQGATIVSQSFEKMLKVYQQENFAECDIAYQHIAHCKEPIHQSVVNTFIANRSVITDSFLRTHAMVQRMTDMGYGERYLIPLLSKFGWFSFAVAHKDIGQGDFKMRIANNSIKLTSIAHIVDKVGCTQHKDMFLSSELSFIKMLDSKPVELFRLCYERDISIKAAAKLMNISQKTTEMHSKKFRLMMNANTTLLAITRAIKFGIFAKLDEDLRLVKVTDRGSYSVVPR